MPPREHGRSHGALTATLSDYLRLTECATLSDYLRLTECATLTLVLYPTCQPRAPTACPLRKASPSVRARCRRSPTLPSVACGAALPAAAVAPLVQLLAQQEEGSRSVE